MPEATFKIKVSVEPDQPDQAATGFVVKSDDEKRFLLTVAYPAMKADVSVAQDGHRDFAPAEVVERAAWNFMLKGAKLGLWHEAGHEGCAETVESYVWRGPDWTIKAADGTEQVIKAGDWLLGVICDPDTWAMYKAGLIGGVSPQGTAKRRRPSAEALAQLRS